MSPVLMERDEVQRLRDEIALLRAVRHANELLSGAYENTRAGYERAADDAWLAAVRAGVPEWDADHPCKAIDQRKQQLWRLRPDQQMADAGAPTLPGFEKPAPLAGMEGC